VNIVDSCGWLEYAAAGPNASFFAPAIENAAELLVPTVTIYEVYKRATLIGNEHNAKEIVAVMLQGTLLVLDASIALEAAALSLELGLPMADSMVLATARLHNASLWTQDAHFRGIEGVRYVEKPEAIPS
jgi:predicted nucleic acid-binding protein